jgi:hypothetical protein
MTTAVTGIKVNGKTVDVGSYTCKLTKKGTAAAKVGALAIAELGKLSRSKNAVIELSSKKEQMEIFLYLATGALKQPVLSTSNQFRTFGFQLIRNMSESEKNAHALESFKQLWTPFLSDSDYMRQLQEAVDGRYVSVTQAQIGHRSSEASPR